MMKKRMKSLLKFFKSYFASNEQYINMLRSEGVKIGRDCIIDKSVEFGTEPYLITLSDHVRIARGVAFITHDGGLWVPRYLNMVSKNADKMGKIFVDENVNVGWNAIIMPGVTIGKNSIIGCGAVVTKNVPENTVVAGVPAKVIESIEKYVEKNYNSLVETKCMEQKEKKKYLLSHLK